MHSCFLLHTALAISQRLLHAYRPAVARQDRVRLPSRVAVFWCASSFLPLLFSSTFPVHSCFTTSPQSPGQHYLRHSVCTIRLLQ
ncbi:hypothetical protein BKA63DRAFT_229634 [Paraphoma chrysanthemicola]|nr:hypothetical protein BKA63DRAFT_229634 [Paraphoma chrysanthemicola]